MELSHIVLNYMINRNFTVKMNRTRWRNAFRKIYETTNEEQENESVSIYHSNDQECITSYADTEEEYYPEIGLFLLQLVLLFSNDKCVCLGIPGGSIMFGSHSNFYRRIIWIGIFVIFLGLTVAQVSDMAEIAFSFPTDE